MYKSRENIIKNLYNICNNTYNNIGDIKHAIRNLFNICTLAVFNKSENKNGDIILDCDIMTSIFSIKDIDNSCSIKLLIKTYNNCFYIDNFIYNFNHDT